MKGRLPSGWVGGRKEAAAGVSQDAGMIVRPKRRITAQPECVACGSDYSPVAGQLSRTT